MKNIAILLVSFLIYQQTFCQQKGAEIKINSFDVYENGSEYSVSCYVSYIKQTYGDKSYFLVALIKVPDFPLQLVQFQDKNERRNDYYLLDRRSNEYLFKLNPYRKTAKEFILHFVLIEGDASAIEKVINVSQNEFDKIEDALDFFYRLKFRPLTYTSIKK